jgi:hypothetical protein
VTQGPAALQKRNNFLTNNTNKEKGNKKKKRKKKKKKNMKTNKRNLCIKTLKDAANSQFLSTIKYFQLYSATITLLIKTES